VRGLGEEGEPSWRSGDLRGNPHLSNVTYLTSCEGTREYIFVSACLGYLYTRVYFLVIAIELEVHISCLSLVVDISCVHLA